MKLNIANSRRGMTKIEVVVVIVILVILAMILLPALPNEKMPTARVNCINNLKQIGVAFKTWAADHYDKYPMEVSMTNGGTMEFAIRGIAFINFLVMSNELTYPKLLICPADKEKSPALSFVNSFNNRSVSYFVGADARASSTNHLDYSKFLSGDRNITNGIPFQHGMAALTTNQPVNWTEEIHKQQGNVLLNDGSVQRYSSARLRDAMRYTGMATNRLVIP